MLLVRTRLPIANPAVIFKPLTDGGVIFAADNEIYFGLNAVGAHLWRLLPPATSTLDELVAELSKAYPDAEPDMIRRDVQEMLDDLEKYQLVLPAPDDATTGSEIVATDDARPAGGR